MKIFLRGMSKSLITEMYGERLVIIFLESPCLATKSMDIYCASNYDTMDNQRIEVLL